MFSLYFQCARSAHAPGTRSFRRTRWRRPPEKIIADQSRRFARKLINAAQRSLFAGIDMMPSEQSSHDYYDEIEHSSGLSEVFSGSFLRPQSVRPPVRPRARSFVRQRVLFEPRRRSPESSGRRRLMSTFLLLPTADRRGAASARKCKLAAREFDSALFVGGRSSGRQTRGRRQRGHLF